MAGGYDGKSVKEVYQNYPVSGGDFDDLQDMLKALVVDGDMIVEGSVEARHIKTGSLVVGDNVEMGENAYISWGNVLDQPSIPRGTYIDANGVYTGEVHTDQLIAGLIEGFTIKQVGTAGSIVMDDNGFSILSTSNQKLISMALDNSGDDVMGFLSFFNDDAYGYSFVGGIGSDNQGNLSIGKTDGWIKMFGEKLWGQFDSIDFQVIDALTTSGSFLVMDSSGYSSNGIDKEATLRPNKTGGYGYLGTSGFPFYKTYTYMIYRDNEYALSSESFKEDIREFTPESMLTLDQQEVNSYDFIKNMQTYKYKRKHARGKNRIDQIGPMVEQVAQDLIDPDGIAIDTYSLLSVLINAVKKLQEKVELLESSN